MKMGTKVGLLHHVGGGNLGDDATLDAVAMNMTRRWPNAVAVAFSMNPTDTEARHGIKSYRVRRSGWSVGNTSGETAATFKETVKALAREHKLAAYLLRAASAVVRVFRETFLELSFLAYSHRDLRSLDLLIVSGGGQLTEKDGPWGFPYTIFKWVVLARSAGVRCMFLNVGAGPLTKPLSKFFARRALAASDYVSFRDEESQTLAREIGFTGESRVCPDAAYGLEVPTAIGNPLDRPTRRVVGFAPMRHPEPDPRRCETQIAYGGLVRKLASFAAWLVGQSYTLSFFGTDIGVDPLAIGDVEAALRSEHGVSPQQRIDQSIQSVGDLLAAMSGMDYVVTCRFHGVIFAHLLNKPVLAIAHHPKVTDLMAKLELSNYCVDIRDFDVDLVQKKFAAMVSNAEEIKYSMAAKLAKNREMLRSQFDELFGR